MEKTFAEAVLHVQIVLITLLSCVGVIALVYLVYQAIFGKEKDEL